MYVHVLVILSWLKALSLRTAPGVEQGVSPT